MRREGTALQLEGTACAKGLYREGHREERGRERLCTGAGGGFWKRLERLPMAEPCRAL